MKKITTLFIKHPNDLGRVINEIDPINNWVFNSGVIASRKYDGTACAIINGVLYKRYDVKKGKSVPENAIPCQKPDEITGHWPHWVKCSRSDNSDKWHVEAFDSRELKDGTYELCGTKIQGNPEKFTDHCLVKHGDAVIPMLPINFESIRDYLAKEDIEGIVFYEPFTGRMCKIRKSDFGIKRK